MKIKAMLFLMVLIFAKHNLFSQRESPVGHWILSKHHVNTIYGGAIKNIGVSKNVYDNEFTSSIIFDTNGNVYHYISDSLTKEGIWKLSQNGRNLKMIYNNGDSYSLFFTNPINFSRQLCLRENYSQLYNNNKDSILGGESIYVRYSNQIIDSNLLLGNWRISHIQKGKKKKVYCGYWTLEYTLDSTKKKKYKESWKWNSIQDNISVLSDAFNPNNYIILGIDEVSEDNLILYATTLNKVIFIYLKKWQ